MLDFITETNSVWQNMRSCGLPLVLYGMGNGADVVLDRMAAEGLTAAGIFASDEFVRGQNFRGFKVEHYSDIKARLENFAVVIAFASELPEVISRFKALAAEHTVFAPHLPLYAGSEEVTNAWLENMPAGCKMCITSWQMNSRAKFLQTYLIINSAAGRNIYGSAKRTEQKI